MSKTTIKKLCISLDINTVDILDTLAEEEIRSRSNMIKKLINTYSESKSASGN